MAFYIQQMDSFDLKGKDVDALFSFPFKQSNKIKSNNVSQFYRMLLHSYELLIQI